VQPLRLQWRERHWKLASLPGICYWSNPFEASLALAPAVRSVSGSSTDTPWGKMIILPI
jgi:hypothetical protein